MATPAQIGRPDPNGRYSISAPVKSSLRPSPSPPGHEPIRHELRRVLPHRRVPRPARRDGAGSLGSSYLIKMIQSSCRPAEQGPAAEVRVGSSSSCCSRRATRKRCDLCTAPARFCSSG